MWPKIKQRCQLPNENFRAGFQQLKWNIIKLSLDSERLSKKLHDSVEAQKERLCSPSKLDI